MAKVTLQVVVPEVHVPVKSLFAAVFPRCAPAASPNPPAKLFANWFEELCSLMPTPVQLSFMLQTWNS